MTAYRLDMNDGLSRRCMLPGLTITRMQRAVAGSNQTVASLYCLLVLLLLHERSNLSRNMYRDMIKANPKWKNVGTYVDEERSYPVLLVSG